jgi:hypothetical protein
MLFVGRDGHEEIEHDGRRRRQPREERERLKRQPRVRRILRDRAIMILYRGGMKPGEIYDFAEALAGGKPAISLSQIYRRIEAAEELARRSRERLDEQDDDDWG